MDSAGGGKLVPSETAREVVEGLPEHEAVDDISPMPSMSSQELLHSVAQTAKAIPISNLTCECGHKSKRKSDFRKHKILHVIQDRVNMILPKERVRREADDFAMQCFDEMLVEPSVSDLSIKKTELVLLLKDVGVNNTAWSHFLDSIVCTLYKLVTKRTKVLPLDQHNECIKDLYKVLANEEMCQKLRSELKAVIPPNHPVQEGAVNLVLYRFLTKMSQNFEILMLQCRRQNEDPDDPSIPQVPKPMPMDSEEKKQFLKEMAALVQALHEKGRENSSLVWQARANCLREQFVTVDGAMEKADFEKNELWSRGIIKFNERATEFFVDLDQLMRSLDSFSATAISQKDIVLNDLYKSENEKLLDNWFWLTVGKFSETECISFLEDIVHCVVNVSVEAEVKKRKKNLALQKVALRTDLKRN